MDPRKDMLIQGLEHVKTVQRALAQDPTALERDPKLRARTVAALEALLKAVREELALGQLLTLLTEDLLANLQPGCTGPGRRGEAGEASPDD